MCKSKNIHSTVFDTSVMAILAASFSIRLNVASWRSERQANERYFLFEYCMKNDSDDYQGLFLSLPVNNGKLNAHDLSSVSQSRT